MFKQKMHKDEVEIDKPLVEKLIASQFPQWSRLSIDSVPSAGTDNAIFRLGSDMAVRLPRIDWATSQVERESFWLPKLAPHVSLLLPSTLAIGLPAYEYPWKWSVCRWLEGEQANRANVSDLCDAARTVAGFILQLHRADTKGAPEPGDQNSRRGEALQNRDERTREALVAVGEMFDFASMTAVWEMALQAPVWQNSPVWIHGDLQPGNLLVKNGKLNAVIDFGCMAVGDPACDLMIAWTLFSGKSRETFRATLNLDEATWTRARGWVLSVALIAIPYYLNTNPAIVSFSRDAIREVLLDLPK